MKLYYVVNARIPTERAHGIQITKMCEAFARKGLLVTLVLPARFNSIKKDSFDFYGLEKNFSIKRLPVIDLLPLKIPFAYALIHLSFATSLWLFFRFSAKGGLVYARNEIVVPLSKLLPKEQTLFWETHVMPKNPMRYKEVVKRCQKIVVITKIYAEKLAKEFSISKDKIITAHDGVDLEKFSLDITKEEARRRLGLSTSENIVLYTGSKVSWKGLDTLIQSASGLGPNTKVFIVGQTGRDDKNIIYLGHKPYTEIPVWLKASDVLVLTGTLKNRVSKFFTSPLKMFEYMASGRPVVASRIPSFEEVLNDTNAFLVEPDNIESLKNGLNKVLNDDDLGGKLALKAREGVGEYSWQKRAELIMKTGKIN